MKIPSMFIWQPKRNARQTEALKNAKRYFESDPDQYANTMFCPYCGEPLIKSGIQRRFETTSEHVSNPNGTPSMKDELICSAKGLFNHQYLCNEDKEDLNMIGCEFGILHCWNDDPYGGFEAGGSYTSDYWYELRKLTHKDIVAKRVIDAWMHEDHQMEFSAALNSHECEVQTSIYHKGLKDKVYVFPFSWKYNIRIDITYNANKFGEVTAIYVRPVFMKIKERHNGFYTSTDFTPIRTWLFLSGQSKRELENAYRFKDFEEGWYRHVRQALKDSFNDGWIYRMHAKWMRFIHPKLTKKLVEKYGKEAFNPKGY